MTSFEQSHRVGVVKVESAEYADQPPFNPSVAYPELPWPGVARAPNPAYYGVREVFRQLGYDAAHFGKREWNPLGWLVSPGDTVVLKPNLIKEAHPLDPDGWRCVLTHGSFIRVVADYVSIALKRRGRIIICDGPQTDSSFERVCERVGLGDLAKFYQSRDVPFDLVDLRKEEWKVRDGAIVNRRVLAGDAQGSVAFDLGRHSAFQRHKGNGHYYGADYDTNEVNQHHTGGRHEYLLSGTALRSDVFVNLPKLKTHKKTGITVSLKNLVGINADKNWLPHHTEGGKRFGGDEFPELNLIRRVERRTLKNLRSLAYASPQVGGRLLGMAKTFGRPIFRDSSEVVRAGNWYGNDTAWRMCLDLNRILLFGDGDGKLLGRHAPWPRRYLSLVDGIVAGEGNGPMSPDPVPAGVVLGGTNPAAVDAVASVLMGFDPDCLPVVANAFDGDSYRICQGQWRALEVVSNIAGWNRPLGKFKAAECFRFKPHFGWQRHVER